MSESVPKKKITQSEVSGDIENPKGKDILDREFENGNFLTADDVNQLITHIKNLKCEIEWLINNQSMSTKLCVSPESDDSCGTSQSDDFDLDTL